MRFALAAGAALLCVGALAQVPLEFKGVPLGAPVERFMALFEQIPEVTCGQPYRNNITCSGFLTASQFTYADQLVDYVNAEFLNGRLASITVSTLPGTASIIEQAIAAKYQAQRSVRMLNQVTPSGQKYQARLVKWQLPTGEISVQDHPAPRSTVFVSIASAAWLAHVRASMAASPKAKRDI